MAILKEIWIEHHAGQKPAIRLDWDNDRHHRIELKGSKPFQVINALDEAVRVLAADLHKDKI